MWICKKCKSEVEDNFEICWNCGAENETGAVSNPEVKRVARQIKTDIARHEEIKKYPSLRFFSLMFKILGYLVFVLTLVAIGMQAQGVGNPLSLLITFVIGFITGLTMLAISEGIIVLVDIEANTSRAAQNGGRM